MSTRHAARQRGAVEPAAGVEAAFPLQERQREGEGEEGGAEGGDDDAEARSHGAALARASVGDKAWLTGGDAALLAQLMAQAAGDGADLQTLRAIAEEAGALGAARAMARIGLSDAAAAGDVQELRELLKAWRDAKRSAVRAALAWVMRMAFALLLVGIAVRTGWGEWAR